MESMLLWGLCLLAAALLLVIVEVFVPSGGVISLVAVVVAISGVVCLFKVSVLWGIAGGLAMLILGPMTVLFALNILPSTPMGKRLLYGDQPPPGENGEESPREPTVDPLEAMVGSEGTAITDLRLGGAIRIDGRKQQAISETSFIPAGSKVRVTGVDGGVLRVRPIA